MPSSDLHGIFTAIVTPFSRDGSTIDYDRLAEQVRFQAEGGVSGVVPCGTTGESPTLSDEEHEALIERTIELARPLGLTVIAGAGSNDTAYAVKLHRFAHDAGADAALQVNPYYNKPSQEGLYRHFSTIADSCALPIVLYNIPGRTAVGLSIETIERLAKHPNIVAVKEATGSLDMTSEIVQRTDLTVLSGDDSLTLPICSVGGRGAVSVVSNIVPDRLVGMWKAIASGAWDQARAIHLALLPLARGLLTLDTNPVPLKAAMHQLGRDTGALRLPLVPCAAPVQQKIGEILAGQKLRPARTAAATAS